MLISLIYPFGYTLFLAIFWSIFLIICSPIYIFRFLLSISVKYLRKDFRMMDARSTIYGIEDVNHKPTSTVVAVAFVKERVHVEKLRKSMKELLFKNKNLIEMTEYVHHWLGFCFWRKDENFNIANHIYEHHTEGTFGDKELQILRADLLARPFAKKRSPWDIGVVHCRYQKSDGSDETVSILLLRFHHSLGDGTALVNFIFQSSQVTDTVKPSFQKQNGKFSNIIEVCKFVLFSPMELAKAHFFETTDDNEWHNDRKLVSKKYFNAAKSGDNITITVNDIKRIKTHFDVSFQSVIYSAIAGSIRKTMEQSNTHIPKTIKVVTQVPIPGYSGRLENHFGVSLIDLPVGEKDSIKRLKAVHKLKEDMRQSTLPYAFYHAIGLIGRLFTWMVRPLAKMRDPTVAVSSFAGPVQTLYFFQIPISDLQISVGLLEGNIGVGFQILTYKGKLAVSATFDKSIFPDETAASNLVNNFLQELNIWHNKSELQNGR